jgi:hypothetical protein
MEESGKTKVKKQKIKCPGNHTAGNVFQKNEMKNKGGNDGGDVSPKLAVTYN